MSTPTTTPPKPATPVVPAVPTEPPATPVDHSLKAGSTTARRKAESYDIAQSDDTLQLSTDVARFIRENKLFINMQGKEYVNVEGWQYAGSRLGILPVVEELTNQSQGEEYKYRAYVRLLNLRTEQFIGAGFAICTNKEPGKKFFQEFAIASMAQTRAIGKAYRNILAWLIRAAGYEPTPAEEMEYTGRDEKKETPSAQEVPPSTPATVAPQQAKVVPVEEPATPTLPLATTRQKAEILLLLNSEAVSQEERDKMLAGINKLDRERADKAIEKLKKTIAQRSAEATQTTAAVNAIRTSDQINTVQKTELHKLLRDKHLTQEEANKVFDAIETIQQVKAAIAKRKGGVPA